MATKKYWVGTTGPFFANDTFPAFRFETTTSTLAVASLAAQEEDSVDIGGGNIDDTVLGASTPAAATFTTTTVSHFTFNGATKDFTIEDSGFATATELAWIEVTVGTTTGYLRVYSAK